MLAGTNASHFGEPAARLKTRKSAGAASNFQTINRSNVRVGIPFSRSLDRRECTIFVQLSVQRRKSSIHHSSAALRTTEARASSSRVLGRPLVPVSSRACRGLRFSPRNTLPACYALEPGSAMQQTASPRVQNASRSSFGSESRIVHQEFAVPHTHLDVNRAAPWEQGC